MARSTRKQSRVDPLKLRDAKDAASELEPFVHIIREGVRCDTEARGHETPRGRSPREIVLDASEGFIPLWAQNTTLRWRFRDRSLQAFEDPEGAEVAIEQLFAEAALAWADAAPVRFAQRDDAWDFEIVMRQADRCNPTGCVLASAFFPDAGRHELVLYPKMFEHDRNEQLETLIHEIGHIFGLRHFFALVEESAWPAIIFGRHRKFSIMNYGRDSKLTDYDKSDLRKLYRMAWSGELTHINGTPIKFVRPFHASGAFEETLAVVPLQHAAMSRVGVAATRGYANEAMEAAQSQSRSTSGGRRELGDEPLARDNDLQEGELDRIADVIVRSATLEEEEEESDRNDRNEFAEEDVGDGFDVGTLRAGKREISRVLQKEFRTASFTGFDFEKFSRRIERLGLRFFKPIELLYLGASNQSGSCSGKNGLPDEDLWPRIENTAKMLDAIRAKLGGPIRILSAYRSLPYNRCIGGESASLHMRFNAIDWRCDVGNVRDWLEAARDIRSSDAAFRGGIGFYPRQRFIHIDTRGREANWP